MQVCVHVNKVSMSLGGNFSSSMAQQQQSSGAGFGGGGSGIIGGGGGTVADRVNTDFPPFSRVFVVCSRGHKEEDIQAAFQQFGQIEDVWMVKDRMTKENKGICYVKYDKASSAALAIENMDGKLVGNEPKPIKVHVCGSCTIMYMYNNSLAQTMSQEYCADCIIYMYIYNYACAL